MPIGTGSVTVGLDQVLAAEAAWYRLDLAAHGVGPLEVGDGGGAPHMGAGHRHLQQHQFGDPRE